MKIYNKIFLMALASLSLVGCADLDTEPLGNTITADQKSKTVENNPERVAASVNAIPTLFSVYGNVYGTDDLRHNDFGYAALMLLSDSRGMDFVSEDIGYNWFSYPIAMTNDWDINGVSNVLTWITIYNQIYAANAVTASIDRAAQLDSVAADPTLQYYLAQALTIRAFDYFHLAQQYQQTYVGHETKPCVPIITEANSEDVAVNGCPRNTVQEVYDMIIKDLTDAITMLEATDVSRPDRRYVDAAVAHGLRARVELVMNKWAEARDDAQAAIDLTDARPATIAEVSKPTFKDMTEPNWMWGIKISEEDRVVTSGIVNWPSHMGSLNYGYASVGAWRYISKKLYKSIGENDVRKGWWLNDKSESVNLNEEQQEYVTSKKIPAYVQVKFAPYKDEVYTETNANDIPLMRVEEMYLILAEATAMAGDPGTGKTILEDFVKSYRNPDYTTFAATGEAVQNAVWNQRRLELWGEGLSYWDILRLKKGIDRRGAGFEAAYVFNITPEDDILIFKIPQEETEANKLIDGDKDNNPTPTVPKPVEDEE